MNQDPLIDRDSPPPRRNAPASNPGLLAAGRPVSSIDPTAKLRGSDEVSAPVRASRPPPGTLGSTRGCGAHGESAGNCKARVIWWWWWRGQTRRGGDGGKLAGARGPPRSAPCLNLMVGDRHRSGLVRRSHTHGTR